jgi:hypothetical protein
LFFVVVFLLAVEWICFIISDGSEAGDGGGDVVQKKRESKKKKMIFISDSKGATLIN